VSLPRSAFSRQLWQSRLPVEHGEHLVFDYFAAGSNSGGTFWDKAERTLLISLFPNAFPYLSRYFGSLTKLVVRPQDFLPRASRFRPKTSLF
jgi:hypothetical protein